MTVQTDITKTLAISLLLGSGVYGFSQYPQSFVTFQNGSLTPVATNSVVGGPATGLILGPYGTAYYFALFSAPSGTVDVTQFTFTGGYASNSTKAGLLYGGSTVIPGLFPDYIEAAVLVRGWSANIGAGYSMVTNYLANPTFDGWYGESQIGSIHPMLPEGPYPAIFSSHYPGIPGFTLYRYTVPLRLLPPTRTGTDVILRWHSVASINYFLQRSTNVISFATVATNIPGQAGTTTYTDVNAGAASPLFYRVGVGSN
jgi:hypothetical protein